MSFHIKPIESKKIKNSTYQNTNHNSNLTNSSKNNKLSFTNAFINNTKKNKQISCNSAKKRTSKHNNVGNQDDNSIPNLKSSKIQGNQKADISNLESYSNEEDIKEMNKKEDEIEPKKNLNKADSYQSIEFLLPKRREIIEKSNEKIGNNRRYMNQEAYDFDGNNIYHNNFDSSGKKKLAYSDISPNKEDDDNVLEAEKYIKENFSEYLLDVDIYKPDSINENEEEVFVVYLADNTIADICPTEDEAKKKVEELNKEWKDNKATYKKEQKSNYVKQ